MPRDNDGVLARIDALLRTGEAPRPDDDPLVWTADRLHRGLPVIQPSPAFRTYLGERLALLAAAQTRGQALPVVPDPRAGALEAPNFPPCWGDIPREVWVGAAALSLAGAALYWFRFRHPAADKVNARAHGIGA